MPEESQAGKGRGAQDSFEALLRQARTDGHAEFADRLDGVMHRTAWTTGTELIGELGLAVRECERSKPTLTPEMRRRLKECRRVVGMAWEGVGW